MANLIIKSSADNLVLQGSDASPAITVGATGTTTFAENATFSGTANNLGTVTATTKFPAGHIIKIGTDTNATTGAGVSVSGSVGSANTHGYQLFNTSFTPLFANSKILLQTSSIFIGEESNSGTYAWLNAWYDTTRVGMVYGTAHYGNFEGSKHWTVLALNHVFDSWGDSAKNINVRAGSNQTSHVKNRSTDDMETQEMTVTLTIMEIAQ